MTVTFVFGDLTFGLKRIVCINALNKLIRKKIQLIWKNRCTSPRWLINFWTSPTINYFFIGTYRGCFLISLVSHSVVSDSLGPHGLQHARLPYPSVSPWVCSNSRPLSQWCHSTLSPSVTPFSSCPQSFPVSGSFPIMSALCINKKFFLLSTFFVCIGFTLLKILSYFKYFSPYSTITSKYWYLWTSFAFMYFNFILYICFLVCWLNIMNYSVFK